MTNTLNGHAATCFYDSAELTSILSLTLELSNQNGTKVYRSRTPEKYWNRVMRLWEKHVNVIGYDVVYAAIYRTHWGTYPADLPANDKLKMLVDLVHQKFETVTPDMRYAKDSVSFSNALGTVLKSCSPYSAKGKNWKSKCYRGFLETKTRFKLYGGEYVVTELNLLATTLEELEEMKLAALARKAYETMKTGIIKLIPCATTWSDDDFSNEASILTHLKRLYGVDYRKHWRCFDSLLTALELRDQGMNDLFRSRLLSVRDMPLSLARVIWPTNTAQHMEELFCWCCREIAKYAIFAKEHGGTVSQSMISAQDNILNGWLGHQIQIWYNNGYKLQFRNCASIS